MSVASAESPPYDGAHHGADAQALAVLLEDRLITFTRAVGLLRRRNLPVHSIAMGPTATPGLSRLTIMMHADQATADRAVQYLRKVVGVRDAVTFPAPEQASRELALVKVRAPPSPSPSPSPSVSVSVSEELLGVVELYGCAVVDRGPDAVVLEVSGPEPSVRACLDALQRFGVLDVARTGAIAIDTTSHH